MAAELLTKQLTLGDLISKVIKNNDDWFIHLIVYNLDADTREEWEKSLEGSANFRTYQQLISFLEGRTQSLDTAHCNTSNLSIWYIKTKEQTHLLNRTIPLKHIILRSRHQPKTQGFSVSLVRPSIISLTARRTKYWPWRRNLNS